MTYQDKTFCPHYEGCEKGSTCHRALTPEVKEQAIKWFGGDDAPICYFSKAPDCYVPNLGM